MNDTFNSSKVEQLSPGDKIKLVRMNGDPDPISVGSEGEVIEVRTYEKFAAIKIAWDDGRNLMMVCPPDDFDIV